MNILFCGCYCIDGHNDTYEPEPKEFEPCFGHYRSSVCSHAYEYYMAIQHNLQEYNLEALKNYQGGDFIDEVQNMVTLDELQKTDKMKELRDEHKREVENVQMVYL